ncbi:tetratricopeptide repeat protein [Caproiciproducens sp. MSJ-32]|mgnify:CR=1 FL=1|uniref:tetratricopeptide repeat protein n=1 Tax=Caproiciproducens sp. MSJ-32 TaxID=2841527 RepID=UPI001C0F69F0|nr:tetratricopeptide repeat protein [Caproiciproducens sp. MSJ-32]MBU5453965.1 tetratricopeptide repeat protein [Caproiciproducens sp. MSJ-32]
MNNFIEGNNFYNNKEYEKAIASYKRAIENGESTTCANYNLGVCYIKLKEYDRAIPYFKKAISMQKESKYFFNLAYCYAMKNEIKKALINFNVAWALDNTDEDCKKAIEIIAKKNKKAQ